ncbi:MAG: MATE family efflux transporter [Faecalibacterium sp.]|nr:MATE family efflux transporter [Ruminococcus sp.]MCM1391464.1 MATE family efflux transporter [Ruminococcus sp.]MCM1485278.1 MATE family efflux transporter [Faecalibacterium sp.]
MKKENKMGVMPIGRLIISMSLPMMISMLVQALYNVVDSVFVSRVSQDALTAVSLAFPMQNLMIGFATGTGVGVNALLSRSLGEKDYDKANTVASNGMFLAFVNTLLFILFGIFGTKLFFNSQISPDSPIYAYGVDYLSVCCIFSFGVFGQVTCERLMQSTGRTTLSMATQLIGALINIILDPLLILGLGPFPRLEAKGAAIATVTGQIVAFIAGLILNHFFNKEISLKFKGFKPSGKMIGEIYKIGIPSIIMVGIGSVMTYAMNKILLGFTDTAAAVFGIYFKLQSFIFMPIFGLNNGTIPIIAYNYGAGNRQRMTKTVKFSLILACSIMAVGTLLMWLIPETMLSLFDASDDLMAIGVPALKTISCSFIIAGFCICIGSVFQAIGKSYFSMIVSIARQLIVLIPVAYFLSKTGILDRVWLAFPIAEAVSLVVSVLCYIYVYKNVILKVGEKQNSVDETQEQAANE